MYKATKNSTGKVVAIKKIEQRIFKRDNKLKKLFHNESVILKECRNLNVVRCYEKIITPKYIYLVMEYCDGGDLDKYVEKNGKVPEIQATLFLKEILNGFKVILWFISRDYIKLVPCIVISNCLMYFCMRESVKFVIWGLLNKFKNRKIIFRNIHLSIIQKCLRLSLEPQSQWLPKSSKAKNMDLRSIFGPSVLFFMSFYMQNLLMMAKMTIKFLELSKKGIYNSASKWKFLLRLKILFRDASHMIPSKEFHGKKFTIIHSLRKKYKNSSYQQVLQQSNFQIL